MNHKHGVRNGAVTSMTDANSNNIDNRVNEIIYIINDIAKSNLTVRNYFSTHKVPFTRSQYYRYLKAYNINGIDGLYDHRKDGNAKKITSEVEHYLMGLLKNNRGLSASEIRLDLQKQFNIDIKRSRINDFRRKYGLERITETSLYPEQLQFAGFEIISALAFHTGIINSWSNTINSHISNVKETELFKQSMSIGPDHPSARDKGRFTKEYNQLDNIRTQKFNSIEDKVLHKDLSRLQVLNLRSKTINKKNLAILSLPLITLNGSVRNINKSIGNALRHICGFNYKHATIDKYLRELKYLQISSALIKATSEFWIKFWSKFNNEQSNLLCYYIDGNTKPIWSSVRCKKSKVTMLGRVMDCLEQAFVHDSFGHPTYFQTYSGNADLGNNALSLMEDIEDYLDSISSDGKVDRVIVIDAAGNAVSTMRNIADSNYYFITMLSDNQINDRKIKHLQAPLRYKYGNADIRDCIVELIDSKEKNYIFECRGVIIDWDYGKQTVIVTDVPKQVMDASEIVRSYFDRWPCQELEFRSMKSSVSIQRISGYGKKKVEDEKMREKQDEVKKRLDKLFSKLSGVIGNIQKQEQNLAPLYKKERELKEKTTIEKGERKGDIVTLSKIEECQKEINKIKREINKLKKPYKEEFTKLKKLQKEWKRIQGKDYVHIVDVELDQLITCFRMSFVNLCSFFLSHCVKDCKMELKTLIHTFFMLSGSATEKKDERIITLRVNEKEPVMMKILSEAIENLNKLNIKNNEGKKYSFCCGST